MVPTNSCWKLPGQEAAKSSSTSGLVSPHIRVAAKAFEVANLAREYRPRNLHAWLIRHENRQTHAAEKVIGDAAQHFFPQARMAEGAGDHQIGTACPCLSQQPVGNRSTRNIFNPNRLRRRA